MKKWKYQILMQEGVITENRLNGFGDEGWELCVALKDTEHNTYFIFKKEITEQEPAPHIEKRPD
ncbi:MAG: hypothetical protein NT155_03340 [Candidatus Staskawiczbacteria bacterium]|nr:hypothetical protein [Candidatus Staskawiczbacteria bacterium]